MFSQLIKHTRVVAGSKKVKVSIPVRGVINQLFAGDNEMLLANPIERALKEMGHDVSINAYSIVGTDSSKGKINAVINYDDGKGMKKYTKFLTSLLRENNVITDGVEISHFCLVRTPSYDSRKEIDENREKEYFNTLTTNGLPVLSVSFDKEYYDGSDVEFTYIVGLTEQQSKLPYRELRKLTINIPKYMESFPINDLSKLMRTEGINKTNTISFMDNVNQLLTRG